MTKDEYHYIFGLTANHPNQELILDFVREMLKSTAIRCENEGYNSAMSRAKNYLTAVVEGSDYKMEGGLHGFGNFMQGQWEKIPTTQDKVNRVTAAKAVEYIGGLRDAETKRKMLERIDRSNHAWARNKRGAREYANKILKGTRPYNQEMVELGKERIQYMNDHAFNYHADYGWGNYATACEYPRCVTGKLLRPGDIIIRRTYTAEERKNGMRLSAPYAISSLDELRETDELWYSIGENWEIIRPSDEEKSEL